MYSVHTLSVNKQKSLKKLHQKKYRDQYGQYLCEGYNLFCSALLIRKHAVNELIISNTLLHSSTGEKIVHDANSAQIPVYMCDESTMSSLADTVTPPGILFTMRAQLKGVSDLVKTEDSSILYFEKISDPGNLGTVIRTALWFGIKTILLSPDCVDPYNMKTIRSSAGAIFECEIYYRIPFEAVVDNFKIKNYQLIATVPSRGVALRKWKVNDKNIIVFGSESKGLSKKVLNSADLLISIYKSGNVESLNVAVAAGIILHEIALKAVRKDS